MGLLEISLTITLLTFIFSVVKLVFPRVLVERENDKAVFHGEEPLPKREVDAIVSFARISGFINILFASVFTIYSIHLILYGVAWLGHELMEYVIVFTGIACLSLVCGLIYTVFLFRARMKDGRLREAKLIRNFGFDHFFIAISCVMFVAELLGLS